MLLQGIKTECIRKGNNKNKIDEKKTNKSKKEKNMVKMLKPTKSELKFICKRILNMIDLEFLCKLC